MYVGIVGGPPARRELQEREWTHAPIWRHPVGMASVEPIGARSFKYRDTVTIEAGPLTPLVAAYAHWFYRVRQRRWRALARELAA